MITKKYLTMSEFVEKIKSIRNLNLAKEKRSPMWEWCQSHHNTVEFNEANLDNMANNELTFGMFGGFGEDRQEPNIKALIRLAQGVGVWGVQNPEGGANPIPPINKITPNYSEILSMIDKKIGFRIQLPEFIGGGQCLKTDYGYISDRHCAYLWIMKRIMELYPFRSDRRISVIEVGAGIGMLGYFLSKVGYVDYTIIDIAHANALQAYFLNKNLPNTKLILSGDVSNPYSKKYHTAIKILHSSDFEDMPHDRWDIMINIDGLTEMGEHAASRYVNNDSSRLFLSINHDMNDYRVIDVCKSTKILKSRYPFWIRDGYTEELYQSIFLEPYEAGLFTQLYKP